jgi:hypothetical protein
MGALRKFPGSRYILLFRPFMLVSATFALAALAIAPPAFVQVAYAAPAPPGAPANVAVTAAADPGFAYPAGISNRKFVDQNGNVYLLKTMSSWSMAQNCTNAEITSALEGLKALGFNAVTVSPFGVHLNDSFGNRYQNRAGQGFFTGAPYASSFGAAWSSMDWIVQEATRLQMTVVLSMFLSWGDTGTTPDLINAGTTNAYNFGTTLATRYAASPNIVWHVMGDFEWFYNQGPANALDALFHGIRDAEASTHRLIIAEPANGSTGFKQFISSEGASGYQWFRQSADEVYSYGSSAVEQFDSVWADTTTYPVVDIEPPYVNAPHYSGNPNQQLRERNYATFIRGGIGINFGHEKWWPFGKDGIFDGGPGWLGILSEAPQLQAKYSWTLVDTFVSTTTWARDSGTFLKTGLGSGDIKAASGFSSTSALVYFPSSRSVVVDTTAIAGTGNVQLRWYDPTTGSYTSISASEPKTASRSIPYPGAHSDGTNDWVLVVDSNTGALAPPAAPTNIKIVP